MAIPLAEAQAQLITVNAALQDLISGKRISELRIGSGDFQRLLRYQEVTFDELKTIQRELITIIDSYNTATPTFRTNAHIPMVVTKELF